MAKIFEWDEQQRKEWKDWVSTRPKVVKELCLRLPPDRLYLLKTSKSRVTIHCYSEDGTVTVNVTGEYNRVLFSRQVFGIKPDDLEECDLPGENEDLGDTALEAGYTNDDINNILIPMIRKEMENEH